MVACMNVLFSLACLPPPVTPSGRKMLRSAFIGFVCTGLGDLTSNTFKVRFQISFYSFLHQTFFVTFTTPCTPGHQNPTANPHQPPDLLPIDPTRGRQGRLPSIYFCNIWSGRQRRLGGLSRSWVENQVCRMSSCRIRTEALLIIAANLRILRVFVSLLSRWQLCGLFNLNRAYRLLTNAISGIGFTVAWQFLQDWMQPVRQH